MAPSARNINAKTLAEALATHTLRRSQISGDVENKDYLMGGFGVYSALPAHKYMWPCAVAGDPLRRFAFGDCMFWAFGFRSEVLFLELWKRCAPFSESGGSLVADGSSVVPVPES